MAMLEPLSILNLVITLAMIAGGIVAYRSGFARTTNEVQERVIHTLESEIQALQERIGTLEQENVRLHRLLAALCSALQLRGLQVIFDGDDVWVNDHFFS